MCIRDSLWAAEQLVGLEPETPTVAVTADGVLRAPLYAGELTASMAFDVLSMGVGEDGSAGFPLVSCYLTGKELRAVAEEMCIRDSPISLPRPWGWDARTARTWRSWAALPRT